MEPINTMSGEAIITLIAVAVILVVFGIPLYVVRRRNRIQVEDGEAEPEQGSIAMEVTSVNDSEPKLAQEPSITPGPLTQEPSITAGPFAVDMTPVPPVKVVRKRADKKATVAPVAEKKPTRTRKPKTDVPSKELKKALKEVADMDKAKPVLSKEFALKHGLKLDEKKTKTTKKTTKSTKTVKKAAPKTKKSK